MICSQALATHARCSVAVITLAVVGPTLFGKTVTLSAADNKTTICLVEGDTLVVALPSPIAPAYRWQSQLSKPSPLTTLNDDYTPPKAGKGDGAQTFRFNAATKGTTTLALNFAKQQPGPAPEVTQIFSVDVTVTSGEPSGALLLGKYQGTTACADCTGIQTVLRLYAKGQNDFADTIYIITRTYQGGKLGDQSFTDRGEWSVMKGDTIDPNATVYALSPGQPDKQQYFLLQPGGAALTGLDGQMKPINAPAIYQMVLKKVN